MRFLLLLLLASCSSTTPLKYKFNSSKAYLASMTDDSVRVAKIELTFKEDTVFASGLDSTYLIAKLYDSEGKELTSVDPSDLTLSCSQDIEAKPFSLKQGVYKTNLLPRVKSPNIRMQVDWNNKVQSPIVILKSSTAPMKDSLLPIHHEFLEAKPNGEVMVGRGSRFPASGSEEFSFVNVGTNKIVKRSNTSRTFNFEYPEHARQNIALQVDDAPNDTVSHTMHSIFMVFPRNQLPVLEQLKNTLDVTLPNGEKMIFNKDSKEIVGGVFSEGAVDISTDRIKRHYPDLKYSGRGVILRVNARGQSPQLGEFEKEKIDMDHGNNGSAEVLIINGTTGQKCRRPKIDFWETLDVAPIEFKFATDEQFEIYLQNNCGFGLPKF
ncbi:MAG: hypothetical protein H0V66_13745 [Bdellovibrionales bacterium]|nr:hypothetical protein [Bdellovibrionales bacterium]